MTAENRVYILVFGSEKYSHSLHSPAEKKNNRGKMKRRRVRVIEYLDSFYNIVLYHAVKMTFRVHMHPPKTVEYLLQQENAKIHQNISGVNCE